MSGISYPPPSENLPIFDSSVFIDTTTDNLTPSTGLNYFLSYPTAQGTENLSKINVYGDSTFYENITLSGTTTAIVFGDGSSMDTAGGGGVGDALLSGGTSSTPQTFTGYNEFDNADGRITLGNTTDTTKIKLEADADQDQQLNIGGQVSIGNPTNGNLILLLSDSSLDNQLDIDGTLQIAGAGYSIQLAGYGDGGTNIYGLQISGGGLLLGNNSGDIGSSYYVQLACSDASDGTLYVYGNLNVTGTYITLNSATFTYASSQVSLNSNFECSDLTCNNLNMGVQLTLSNTISGTATSSNITQSSSIVETLVIDGNIQLSGGTNRFISLNYTGQPDITLEQNYTGNLQISAPIEISPNLITYPGNTNTVAMGADPTTNNQLDVEGSLKTTGQIIITGSGNGITFPNNSIQTVAYTGGAPILATYTSTALDTGIAPYTWSFTGISNSLGNQVNWILYSNSAITTSSASTVYTDLDPIVQPSALNNYIFGSGTAIQIPYKYSDGTTTTTQPTYYPTATVALGGFTLSAIADASVNSTFRVDLNSTSNTAFTNGSTLTLKFYAN
jgi:hypothetical protein